jgi:hypothetical protein
MRFGFLPDRIFFGRGEIAFLQGVCGKNDVLAWCFCGGSCGELLVKSWFLEARILAS